MQVKSASVLLADVIDLLNVKTFVMVALLHQLRSLRA